MLPFRRLAAAVAMALAAAPLAAQSVAQNATAPSTEFAAGTPALAATPTPAAEAAPSVDHGGLTVAPVAQANDGRPGPADAPPPPVRGRNTAMMIVGGAGLIVGAVIGGTAGTLVMLGGAAVGLFGLWNYLQ